MTEKEDLTYSPLPPVSLRDYFASQAMSIVMQETQEMRINSFWDWLKQLMVNYLHFTFLSVRFVKIEGVYNEAAKRAYEYADALLSVRNSPEYSIKVPEASLKRTAKEIQDQIFIGIGCHECGNRAPELTEIQDILIKRHG